MSFHILALCGALEIVSFRDVIVCHFMSFWSKRSRAYLAVA